MRVDLDTITIIYRDSSGEEHTQPLSDIAYSGILIDEETWADMEIIAAEVRTING